MAKPNERKLYGARKTGTAECYDCGKRSRMRKHELPSGWVEHALDHTLHCKLCAETLEDPDEDDGLDGCYCP